ncbi:exportin-2 [Hevea brasiliensis]|uniref:exportin-2 n=1 Tax=Hevea brasiliensis TaxID=3981 RepID=UPI0025DD874E|nr:exportin-2 [Hevea brasiliensis]
MRRRSGRSHQPTGWVSEMKGESGGSFDGEKKDLLLLAEQFANLFREFAEKSGVVSHEYFCFLLACGLTESLCSHRDAQIRFDPRARFSRCHFAQKLFQAIASASSAATPDSFVGADNYLDLVIFVQEKTALSHEILCKLFKNVFFELSRLWKDPRFAYGFRPRVRRLFLRVLLDRVRNFIERKRGEAEFFYGRSNKEKKCNEDYVNYLVRFYQENACSSDETSFLDLFAAVSSRFPEDRRDSRLKIDLAASTQPLFPLELLRVIGLIYTDPLVVDERLCVAAATRLKIHLKTHKDNISNFEMDCIKTLIVCLRICISPDFFIIQRNLDGALTFLLSHDSSWHQPLVELILKLQNEGLHTAHTQPIIHTSNSIIWKLNDKLHWMDRSFYDEVFCFQKNSAASVIEISNQAALQIDSFLSMSAHDASAHALRSLLDKEWLCHRILNHLHPCDLHLQPCELHLHPCDLDLHSAILNWKQRTKTYLSGKYEHLQQLVGDHDHESVSTSFRKVNEHVVISALKRLVKLYFFPVKWIPVVLSKIIIPSLAMSEEDEHLFTTNHLEFITRDMLISDGHTRRGLAYMFLEKLLSELPIHVPLMVMKRVKKMLRSRPRSRSLLSRTIDQEELDGPHWRRKECAIRLVVFLLSRDAKDDMNLSAYYNSFISYLESNVSYGWNCALEFPNNNTSLYGADVYIFEHMTAKVAWKARKISLLKRLFDNSKSEPDSDLTKRKKWDTCHLYFCYFFQSSILPELLSENMNTFPMLKAAALKFCYLYLDKFPVSQELLISLKPWLTRFLESDSSVVQSYASRCIVKNYHREKIEGGTKVKEKLS